jgi:hypothetical protein
MFVSVKVWKFDVIFHSAVKIEIFSNSCLPMDEMYTAFNDLLSIQRSNLTTVHTANRRRMLEVLTRNPHKFKALLRYFNGNVIRNCVVVGFRVPFNRREASVSMC